MPVFGTHAASRPTRGAAHATPVVGLPYDFSRLPAGFSAEVPNAKNLIVGN